MLKDGIIKVQSRAHHIDLLKQAIKTNVSNSSLKNRLLLNSALIIVLNSQKENQSFDIAFSQRFEPYQLIEIAIRGGGGQEGPRPLQSFWNWAPSFCCQEECHVRLITNCSVI